MVWPFERPLRVRPRYPKHQIPVKLRPTWGSRVYNYLLEVIASVGTACAGLMLVMVGWLAAAGVLLMAIGMMAIAWVFLSNYKEREEARIRALPKVTPEDFEIMKRKYLSYTCYELDGQHYVDFRSDDDHLMFIMMQPPRKS